MVQAVALAVLFSKRHLRLMWCKLAVTALRAILASAAMTAICLLVLHNIPAREGTWNALARVSWPLVAGAATYVGILAVIGRGEWRDLVTRR
jgi:peptidoglycan biosynthesis protein MviN/MurJ (putative lipid II flippase)